VRNFPPPADRIGPVVYAEAIWLPGGVNRKSLSAVAARTANPGDRPVTAALSVHPGSTLLGGVFHEGSMRIPCEWLPALWLARKSYDARYWRSYSPLLTRLSTLNPAFLASEMESVLGELKVDHTRRTGFLQAGHLVRGAADSGRRKVNFPPHTTQLPSQSSYSYKGITVRLYSTIISRRAKVKGQARSESRAMAEGR